MNNCDSGKWIPIVSYPRIPPATINVLLLGQVHKVLCAHRHHPETSSRAQHPGDQQSRTPTSTDAGSAELIWSSIAKEGQRQTVCSDGGAQGAAHSRDPASLRLRVP